jgi:hypothetical protein
VNSALSSVWFIWGVVLCADRFSAKGFSSKCVRRCCVLTLARKGNTLLYYLCFGFNRFSLESINRNEIATDYFNKGLGNPGFFLVPGC